MYLSNCNRLGDATSVFSAEVEAACQQCANEKAIADGVAVAPEPLTGYELFKAQMCMNETEAGHTDYWDDATCRRFWETSQSQASFGPSVAPVVTTPTPPSSNEIYGLDMGFEQMLAGALGESAACRKCREGAPAEPLPETNLPPPKLAPVTVPVATLAPVPLVPSAPAGMPAPMAPMPAPQPAPIRTAAPSPPPAAPQPAPVVQAPAPSVAPSGRGLPTNFVIEKPQGRPQQYLEPGELDPREVVTTQAAPAASGSAWILGLLALAATVLN